MKIAVLLAAPWIPGSVDMAEYIRVLRSLGHDAMLICKDRSEGPADIPVECADGSTLSSASFYRALELDAVIAFTWLGSSSIVRAIKEAGVRVLLRGDTDGLFSIRCFPRHHFRAMMSGVEGRGILCRTRVAKHWLYRYLGQYKFEDNERLASLTFADVTVVETPQAARNVAYFLRMYGRSDLTSRMQVFTHFVAEQFLNGEVPAVRAPIVTSIGRWEDPQKNANLLEGTIRLCLARRPQTKFNIIGSGSDGSVFSSLMREFKQVNCLGPQKPSSIRKVLASSQILLSSSRWEGAPVTVNEALAMGVTVVGTPIPAFVDLCGTKAFGTMAHRHTPSSLAAALGAELCAWESQERDPQEIAAFWRPKLSSQFVISSLTKLLNPGQPVPVELEMPRQLLPAVGAG